MLEGQSRDVKSLVRFTQVNQPLLARWWPFIICFLECFVPIGCVSILVVKSNKTSKKFVLHLKSFYLFYQSVLLFD